MRVRESCEVKGLALDHMEGEVHPARRGQRPVFVGDVNADGLIGVADILLVLSVLGTAFAP